MTKNYLDHIKYLESVGFEREIVTDSIDIFSKKYGDYIMQIMFDLFDTCEDVYLSLYKPLFDEEETELELYTYLVKAPYNIVNVLSMLEYIAITINDLENYLEQLKEEAADD